jgi:tetratricopeptide (TPR) repeat protein
MENSPQTLTNELLERLSVFDLDNVPSEFEAQLFIREAKKLIKVDASESWMITGIIYSLIGEYKKTKNAFDKSLSFAPQDFETVVVNYARALKILGKLEESYEVIEKHFVKDSFMLSDHAYLYALHIGLFEKAKYYHDNLLKFPSHDKSNTTYLSSLIDACKELDVSEEELNLISLLVTDSIYKYKKIPLQSSVEVNFEDHNSLILSFYIDAKSDTLAKIEFDVVSKLATSKIPSIINHKVTPIILKGKSK